MAQTRQVSRPPSKPVLIYDGECDFCKRWIRRWQQATGETVEYLESQNPRVQAEFPEVPPEAFQKAVQLITPDGEVCEGAEAVFRSLAQGGRGGTALWAYRNVPGFALATEACYRFVAGHRTFFSFLTRLFWGGEVERPTYFWARWLFLRGLGVIYLIAFASLWTQIDGLVGGKGILPAERMMAAAQSEADRLGIGLDRYRLLPTLCWLSTSDSFLEGLCFAGAGLAILIIVGLAPAPSLFLAWLVYLSLSTICGVFLGYQWDNLLLETGFLAIFLAPLSWRPSQGFAAASSTLVLWLLRWLLFRLTFSSGCVKLLSGDAAWRNFTALNFHYETQPLPTWIGWYVHQLPDWFHAASVIGMFAIELIVPFFIFGPRRLRLTAFVVLILLQLLIIVTGNYCFFNLLTIALCLLLLDDATLQKILSRRLHSTVGSRIKSATASLAAGNRHHPGWPIWITGPVTFVILVITSVQLLSMLGVEWVQNAPLHTLQRLVAPFRSINHYGLFAIMTTSRPEIIVEGTRDGEHWLPYHFKHKPGDLTRRPSFVAPHQPRLDWQMWFAALGRYEQNGWLIQFCVRLMEGSPPVLKLLKHNPFPDSPPQYIRAVVYDYRFTDSATRRRTGELWRREPKGLYCPVMSRTGFITGGRAAGSNAGQSSPNGPAREVGSETPAKDRPR